jgi:mono/diheme cytochrome c family protein
MIEWRGRLGRTFKVDKAVWPGHGRLLTLVLLMLAEGATGCKPPLPPSKPLADLTPQEADGYAVFRTGCSGCHYANREDSLRGPGLQGLFKKPYLPSGAPANDDRVLAPILQGRGMMPAFGNQLDDQQLHDLLAYLHTL